MDCLIVLRFISNCKCSYSCILKIKLISWIPYGTKHIFLKNFLILTISNYNDYLKKIHALIKPYTCTLAYRDRKGFITHLHVIMYTTCASGVISILDILKSGDIFLLKLWISLLPNPYPPIQPLPLSTAWNTTLFVSQIRVHCCLFYC